MSKCFDIIGDLGEEELYEEYIKEKDLKRFLCTKYSNNYNLDKKTELWNHKQYSLQLQPISEAYSEPCQLSKIELFAKIV